MCQLGAVVFSRQRIFRQDGIRSHSELNPLAKSKWPREKFYNAEYDFVNREWGMANDNLACMPNWAMPMLKQFEQENWANADMLMNFVLHAGTPEDDILTREAQHEFKEAVLAAWGTYNKAEQEVWSATNKAYVAARNDYYAKIEEANKAKDYKAVKAIRDANDAIEKAILQDYYKARQPALDEYDRESRYDWCAIFSNPKNRIPIWREE